MPRVYKEYKDQLKNFADTLKDYDDKPYRRMMLNDYTDQLKREVRNNDSLSKKRQEYYCESLTNYCIMRHRK